MKRISIVARQRIINFRTMKVHNDNGLRALNGYFEDIVVVEDPFNETTFILQHEENHPALKGWDFQIKEMQE